MTPVQVTARLRGQVALPGEPIALDALVAAMVCLREGRPPATSYEEMSPVSIPIEPEPGGRFHLCSHSIAESEERDRRRIIRRPVIAEAQVLGRAKGKGAITRMQINAGASKAYLFPIEVGHLLGDEMVWYAEAIDVDELRELLSMCSHIGRRRAVGLGRVESWQVEECERWPGFPVLWEGAPLRPLPVDWPGLEPGAGWVLRRRLTYPYWCGPKEEVACPPRSM